MATINITTRARGITVERVVFKALGAYVPGAVERTLDRQYGLSALADHLPPGTTVRVQIPTEDEKAAAIEPIRLVD